MNDGTGEQFATQVIEWRGSIENQVILCPGDPGAGKSIKASLAVTRLKAYQTPKRPVIYIFFDYRLPNEQQLGTLYSTLLGQLASTNDTSRSLVVQLYDEQKSSSVQSLETKDLKALLKKACSTLEDLYIIVDALDECQDSRTREEIVVVLRSLQPQRRSKLLFTSRMLPNITKQFSHDKKLFIRASCSDLNAFQLAKLHMDSLANAFTENAVEAALLKLDCSADIKDTEKAYDLAYNDAMDRALSHSKATSELVKRIFIWVAFAKQPLTKEEL
ncbi:hypothetical protein LTR49_027440 [Elasticomyces elasticus]|nr:hypothetical protein LTR49_027440 [Elasticomyces elasticus]